MRTFVTAAFAIFAFAAQAQAAVVIVQPSDPELFTVGKILNHGIVGNNAGDALDPSREAEPTDEELDELRDLVRQRGGDVEDASRLSNTEIGGEWIGTDGDRTLIEVIFRGGSIIISVPTRWLQSAAPNFLVGGNARDALGQGSATGGATGQEYVPPPPPSGSQGDVDWSGPVDNGYGGQAGDSPCASGEVDINGDPIPV